MANSGLKEIYLNLENNNLSKTEATVLVKNLASISTLEKLILNLSWNPI